MGKERGPFKVFLICLFTIVRMTICAQVQVTDSLKASDHSSSSQGTDWMPPSDAVKYEEAPLPPGDYPEADGDFYFLFERYDLALPFFERAVRLNPTAYNLFLLGVCYHNEEQHEAAVITLTRSIKAMSTKKPGFWVYADRPRKDGDEYFLVSIAIPMTYKQLDAWWYRADSKRMLGDYRGGIDDFTMVLSVDSVDHSALYYRAACKYSLENISGAYSDASRAISIFKDSGDYYYLRGACHIALGRKEQGCRDMSRSGELGTPQAYEVIRSVCN